MKVVLGVDNLGRWHATAQMIRRLVLPHLEVHLVHAVEPFEALGSPLEGAFNHPRQADPCSAGDLALKQAEAMLICLGAPFHRHILRGEPAVGLLEVSEQVDADLIAVGSERKGAFGGFFYGSVGRGMVIGAKRSVLICKEVVKPDRPFTAVLATDHSDYMDRCVERLLALAPGGIDRLVVMTANRMSSLTQKILTWDVPDVSNEAAGWVREKLEQKTKTLCQRLAPLGATCQARVISDHPVEAIRTVMSEESADLLILGAQGHNFIDRLCVGSVSLHAVVAEPFNVMVLRP
jgi:nucleotide-binding universal stress UspA family protein